MLHESQISGRRVCHIAWRALAQTRRAGGGRKTMPHHTPAGAPRRFWRSANSPRGLRARRLEPTRLSPLARVGNGFGRAPVPVPARIARHDRAHNVRSLLNRR